MNTVLFLCPHHAAKSVIASAYCERLAREAGLGLRVLSAGTEPDAAIMPSVAQLLEAEGFRVAGHTPRTVTREELELADAVVTLGCDLEALGVPAHKRRDWRDVPPASADVIACRDAILERLPALIAQLGTPLERP